MKGQHVSQRLLQFVYTVGDNHKQMELEQVARRHSGHGFVVSFETVGYNNHPGVTGVT